MVRTLRKSQIWKDQNQVFSSEYVVIEPAAFIEIMPRGKLLGWLVLHTMGLLLVEGKTASYVSGL